MHDLMQSPALMGLCAGLITWIFTTFGSAVVFLRRQFSRKTLDILLGFAAGVMLAASVWSLLLPALDLAKENWGNWNFIPAAAGIIIGAACLRAIDYLLPHIHPLMNESEGLGVAHVNRHFLLILAITLHNIPEALAVGVAFGAVSIDPELGFAGAFTLMLGIGLQNLPEGMAVSIPLLQEGCSRRRAFFYGQLSGIVEPIAALIGALLAATALAILPWAMAFAAGAMIFVTVEEVLPEAHASGNGDAATMGVIAGFVCMMCLDSGLG